jgi:hypothetical protein
VALVQGRKDREGVSWVGREQGQASVQAGEGRLLAPAASPAKTYTGHLCLLCFNP